MPHRIFVALPISKKLQEEILRWEIGYARFPVRWISGKNLHITLIPPWHTEDVAEAKEMLGSVSPAWPIEFSFTRVSFGPDPRRPRLIWATGETPKDLVTLRDRIAACLGQTPERKPFRSHLTLARFREEHFSVFPVQTLEVPVAWRDTIRSFMLMESHLARSGADYEIIKEFFFEYGKGSRD